VGIPKVRALHAALDKPFLAIISSRRWVYNHWLSGVNNAVAVRLKTKIENQKHSC
jgi:hypothetical protein